MNPIRQIFRSLFVGLVALALCVTSQAAPKATVSLDRTTMNVGEGVELTINVDGATEIEPPNEILVDGLEVRYRGFSRRFQTGTGGTSFSVELKYLVDAKKAGTFTIPPVEFNAGGETVRTQAVALTVEAPSATPSADGKRPANEVAFAELVVPKNTAYIGETIPIEFRLYVDSRTRLELEGPPTVEGEGFTKIKFPNPRQEQSRRDGREYNVIVFRTAVTPSRAGKISLGPSNIIFQAQVPRAQRNRGRSAFQDIFGDDMFSDPFFAQRQRITATAPASEIDVKPLPVANRPSAFAGAVGQFKLNATGNPGKVQLGDPVTMKITVSGRGSFDRVAAPELVDPAGWHAYPAKGDLQADDELAISGSKTFEMAVVPETKKVEMPRFAFVYFDPAAAKYVTLNSERTPLVVEGSAPPPPPVAKKGLSVTEASPSASSGPEPTPPVPTDIVGLRYDAGRPGADFTPLYERRGFLLAQAVPTAGLLAIFLMRRLGKDERARRVAASRKRRAEHWRNLRAATGQAAFFTAAMQVVQAATALTSEVPEGAVDAAVAKSSRPLDDETAAVIDDVFHARGELVYAGSQRSEENVSPEIRTRVLAGLERFERTHAKS